MNTKESINLIIETDKVDIYQLPSMSDPDNDQILVDFSFGSAIQFISKLTDTSFIMKPLSSNVGNYVITVFLSDNNAFYPK